jgi:hypothetical protein
MLTSFQAVGEAHRISSGCYRRRFCGNRIVHREC